MTINFTAPKEDAQLKPRITVFGVGGAGGNAVNNMINNRLDGVDFVVANTDAQAIAQSNADRQIQLGASITHGLGAGARPDMGRAAAEEAIDEITQHLSGSHMVFIAAGMGGGTGTGAAPVIARLAREQGMLTVGVVTKPFQFEGTNRMKIADAGIEEIQQFVDTLIVIPNQNLFRIANEKTTFADAFAMADDVLHSGVRGVTDLMVVPGLINLDFADIRSVMSEMGKAMMGTGEAEGDDRARLAAEAAISNPLLDDVSMRGARGVLINITGGQDMTLFEVDEAANRIGEEVDTEANIIFGSALDPTLEGKLRVSVVATGIDIDARARPRPVLQMVDEKQIQPSNFSAKAERNTLPNPDLEDLIETKSSRESETEQDHQPAFGDLPPNRDPAFATKENFIPPEPVATEKKLENKISPDPFREAELLNSASANENKRGPSLLQRMTKAAWPLRGSATEAKIQDKPHEQKSLGVNSEPPRNTISPKEKIAGLSESDGEAAEDTFSVETHYRDQGLEP
ncbi:MAG: cell division protein FtsZ, partial [Rhodospirillaceae bacterium]